MNTSRKYRTIDTSIFIYFNLFIAFMLYQLHLYNYKYSIINDFNFKKAIILVAIIFTLNGFIYFQFDNIKVFRISVIIQFYLIFLFALISLNNNYIPYIPLILLVISTIYKDKKIYMLHLSSYLGVVLGDVFYIAYSIVKYNNTSLITRTFATHILIALLISLAITIIYNSLNKTKITASLDIDDTKNDEDFYIKSITAVENEYTPQLNVLSDTMSELINGTDLINTIISDLKKDLSVVSSNSKSVSSLSSNLRKDVNAISAVSNKINKITTQAKKNLVTISELFNSLMRTSLNVSSTHKNIADNLDNIQNNTELLNDILIELENLSVVTTHLANKTTIEANQTSNSDVLNIIIDEFHNYAEEIRKKIINMSTIFNKLNSNYYSCKQELAESDNLIASHGLIISNAYKSLDTINIKFNEILKSTSQLEGIITSANIKTKNLVADSYELNNALHQFGKVSYAISRLNKK